ncbi:GNAT family N-acetyltransferase [Paenibacillus sp. GbtcB18]|uniref:GNAT family N-acetyltransferase n=1 Tax=Paenibacillus sp. GbtcB18 TaxID=2824763 RepID=UPI001C307E90|nr:GNAT family N-acetyltransferase [Paenibacillus sp. GbtcB18]
MDIRYSHSNEVNIDELRELFLSVDWESGKHPEELHQAILNSHSVVTAWHGDKLVGLVNALSDGVMTAYFHYLLVRPDYQNQGIGKELMTEILGKYREYKTKVLISYAKAESFYRSLGFRTEKGAVPLYISELV